MILFSNLVLLAWIGLGLYLFSKPDKVRALLVIVILGWLFLPAYNPTMEDPAPLTLPGVGVKFTKLNTISYAVLAGGLLFDRRRWLQFRPTRMDLPMGIWCICPLFSSLHNDLGVYDGFSSVIEQIATWGVMYLAGRIYITDLESFRRLVLGIIAGVVGYLPLCWIEVRLSPQLHYWIYGFYQHEFFQTMRYGGFRPMVFMPHSLVVAMWLAMGTLLVYWLWRCGCLKKLPPLPLVGALSGPWALGLLIFTCVLCKSTGAFALCLMGAAALTLSRTAKSSLFLAVLMLIPPAYITVRATGMWTGEDAVAWIAENYDPERAESLGFRMSNENMLAAKALEMPIFGWGGWGRSRIFDESGRDVSVTDGGWIIALGERGLIGMIAWTIAMMLPSLRFLKDVPPRLWSDPRMAPLAATAVLLVLSLINNLLNVDNDPAYGLALGGLTSVLNALALARQQPKMAARRTMLHAAVPTSQVEPLHA